MLFTSYNFLFFFLPVVLLVAFALKAKARNGFLAAASYFFYGWWNPWFLLLILGSSALDFRCGAVISTSRRQSTRRAALWVSLIGNLSLLGFFKYFNFAADNANALAKSLGGSAWTVPEIVLPVGISFFTFQSMSYSLDLYRGRAEPARTFLDFATYVALFPQLIAGPIIRYRDLSEQIRQRTMDVERLVRGLSIFSIGLAKKVLLANNLAPIADAAFAAEALPPALAWVGVLAYALQIYFDFSGYSDMAIGLGLCLGFVFPQNFDAPYRAESITDFWRRWHISLSTWLRDYLYIPLGGNRGSALFTYRNLMLTMLLGGLWHGANWTFVVWGALHGLLLASERALGKRPVYAGLPRPFRLLSTGVLLLITWVFFRANSLSDAVTFIASMVGLSQPAVHPAVLQAGVLSNTSLFILVGSLILSLTPWRTCDWLSPDGPTITPARALIAAALFVISVLEVAMQGYNPFLYFQF